MLAVTGIASGGGHWQDHQSSGRNDRNSSNETLRESSHNSNLLNLQLGDSFVDRLGKICS